MVLVGSIPTPKFFSNITKNFEGGTRALFGMEQDYLGLEGTYMLKKRDLQDCHALYELMTHPEVFPFVRQKAYSYDEFLFMTKQTIEAEERGELISRTILDEWGAPIGTINLFDIQDQAGFLGTWLGKPYHGKGYNKTAKDAFFDELFYEAGIETIFMRIRNVNIRSQKAAEKLPYIIQANETRKHIFEQLNKQEFIYNLYEIPKDLYTLHVMRSGAQPVQDVSQLMEA
jgi:RimJ/RimL family protein N-acetyltransferase